MRILSFIPNSILLKSSFKNRDTNLNNFKIGTYCCYFCKIRAKAQYPHRKWESKWHKPYNYRERERERGGGFRPQCMTWPSSITFRWKIITKINNKNIQVKKFWWTITRMYLLLHLKVAINKIFILNNLLIYLLCILPN